MYLLLVGWLDSRSKWTQDPSYARPSLTPLGKIQNALKLAMGGEGSVFFYYVKIKSVRETFFWPFSEFFHAQKIAFTHTILKLFTGGSNFSRAHFWIFSRMEILVSREKNNYFEKFSRIGFFFSRIKKRSTFF